MGVPHPPATTKYFETKASAVREAARDPAHDS